MDWTEQRLAAVRELRSAIDAKAASLIGSSAEDTRARRRYAAHPRRFIASGAAGHWLSQSPEYHARQQAQRAGEGRRLRLCSRKWGGSVDSALKGSRLAGPADWNRPPQSVRLRPGKRPYGTH